MEPVTLCSQCQTPLASGHAATGTCPRCATGTAGVPWWAAPPTIVLQTPPVPTDATETPWWAAPMTLTVTPTAPARIVPAPTVAPPRTPRRWRLPVACLAAGILCCVAIGAGLLLLPPHDDDPLVPPVARQEAPPRTRPLPVLARHVALVAQVAVPPRQTEPIEPDAPLPKPPPELDDPFVDPPAPDEPLARKPPPKFVGPPEPPIKPPVDFDQPADPKVAKLIEALQAPAKADRLAALRALGNYGNAARKAVPAVGALLHAKDNDLGLQASRTLAQIGHPAVPALVKALTDKNGTVRHRAAWAFSLIGPEAREAVPALADALTDANEQVRCLSATALGEIGLAARPAGAALVKALADPNLPVRTQAALALRQLGPTMAGLLGKALTDQDVAVRLGTAQALSLFGPEGVDAVPQMAAAVQDADPRVRLAALAALGTVGPSAKEALPALVEALQIKHLETQVQAYSAILRISIDDPDQLAAVLREVTQKTRWATPYVLAQFGPKAQHAVKPLIKLLEDRDPNVRLTAAVALGHLGPKTAAEAVPALTQCLRDPVPAVRTSAAVALAELDDNRRDAAIEALKKALAQLDEMYLASQARLALLSGGSPFLNPAALTDPVLQAQYDRIVGLFIVAMTMRPCKKTECDNLNPIQEAVRATLARLGPAATPALVRGLNYVGRYNIGFV